MIKIWLSESAFKRDVVLINLMNKSDTWYEHMLKIFFYHDIPDAEIDKWMREVFSCYPKVSKYKHNNKYPKAKEIYHSIFGSMEEDGITKQDIEIEMEFLNQKNPDYAFCHTADEWRLAIKFLHSYCEWLSDKLSKGDRITPTEAYTNIERCYQDAIK